MAPRLPDRYETRVRLGRDGDVEEWLATDTSLDRPVLVRILDASADEQRRSGFITAARAAAAAHHVGLAEVYALGTTENPFAVLEWHGGVSIADRLRAGETLSVADFLTTGPRLASGLAALHESGAVHGGVDTAAIGFAGAQPAKLGAFGRRPRYTTAGEDTAALAAALRIAVTGTDIPGIRPSQVAEGLPQSVDSLLAQAEEGRMSAAGLAASLRAQQIVNVRDRPSTWSWRWTWVSAVLIAAALFLSAAGTAIEVDPESPFLFPAVPAEAAAPTPTLGNGSPAEDSEALVAEATGFHPSSETFPNEDALQLVVDESRSTSWRTLDYVGSAATISPDIGIVFTVAGTPRFVELTATPGTGYEVRWASESSNRVDDWERLFSGTTLAGPNLVRVPERTGGMWLLWLTGLPEDAEGRHHAEVGSVVFLP